MNKKIFATIMSFALAICLLSSSMSIMPVYAMENEVKAEDEGVMDSNSGIVPYAGNDVFEYATEKWVGSFTFTGTNLTPVKTVANDPRMHRIIYKIKLRQADNLSNSVRFRFAVVRQNGKYYYSEWLTVQNGVAYDLTNNPADTGINVDTPISPGEKIQFYFQADGSNRKILIEDYWIYCD